MKHDLNATDSLRLIYPKAGAKEEFGREVTIQLTEKCNLVCTYCYQTCKSSAKMSWEVGKRIVDLLYEMWDADDENGFINKNTKQVILSFIGGEPMLELELMDKICDYFYRTAIKKRHIWAQNFMISISSNGTIYFNEAVQNFLKKWRYHLSFSISIDGMKEMHDACRVFPDGSGSFDLAMAAQTHFNENFYSELGTKATIARANLPYLSDIVKYYDKQGFTQIHANCVYEEDWNAEDGKLLYEQLKDAADYILSLDHELELAFFEENFFHPKEEDDLQNWCGGTNKMLAFDPDGKAFPCIRYMHSSLNDDQPPLSIGNCWDGLYCDEESQKNRELLDKIDRRTQSTDECFYCDIAEGCSWCFRGDTLISTPNGDVPICELNIGDKVLDNDGNPQDVLSIYTRVDEHPLKLSFADGKELFTTNEHPILTPNGFVQAANLSVGDTVLTTTDETQVVEKDTNIDAYEVYNLSVDNTHTFIANGIKVHNCSGWNYQLSGTPDCRCTRICDMHKARSLANVYFWNKKYRQEGLNKRFKRYLSDEESLKYISQDELDMLNELERGSGEE